MDRFVLRKRLAAAVALLTLAAVPAAQGAAQPRVVGGSAAPDGVYNAVAHVVIAGQYQCTGTLISASWVLTAGHCGSLTATLTDGAVVDPNPWPASAVDVTLGTTDSGGSGGENLKVDDIQIPSQYRDTAGYDIALLHLSQPSAQTPVHIAGVGEESLWKPGVMETIAGFGVTSDGGSLPDVMQVAHVPIVADATCSGAYPDSFESDTQICAGYPQGGIDACNGDSGGPLFGRTAAGEMKLVGATSYGDHCARAGKYGVYARLSGPTLRAWIADRVPDAIDAPTVGRRNSFSATLTVARAARTAFRAKGIKAALTCSVDCTVVLKLKVSATTARRLGLRSRTIAAKSIAAAAGQPQTLHVRVASGLARRVARYHAATMRLTAALAAADGGTRTLVSHVIRLR